MNSRRVRLGKIVIWLGLAVAVLGALSYFMQHTPTMARFDSRLPGLYLSVAGIATIAIGTALAQQSGTVHLLGVRVLPISFALTALYVGFTFFAYREEEVRIESGDVTLAGTLLVPNGAGPHPAVVMLHGAGESTRMGMFAEAQSLVRSGVAALIYDKRGSGATEAGHYRFDGYEALAGDGAAAFGYLRSRHDIDPDQIGFWGISEGGWTAPMAAAKVENPAFLVIVSGAGTLTVEEQGWSSMESRLRLQGFPEEEIDRALALSAMSHAYIRNGRDRAELLRAVEEAEGSDWFEAAFLFGLSAPKYSELTDFQRWSRDHLDTNVTQLLEQMEFPLLYVLGASDPMIPATRVKVGLERLLEGAGHDDFAVKVFPEATHNIIVAPTDCHVCLPDPVSGPFLPVFSPGYLGTVSDWVTQRVVTAG